jgi:hypothetical protein
LREEYLAALDPFERAVPSLFDKRLRVEVMTNSNVEKVIVGTCAANDIVLEHGVDTARLIIAQLDDKRVGVQLAYLQVYLDHLYRMVAGGAGPVTFTDAAITDAGKLGDVMAGFLDEQEKAIEVQLGGTVPPGAIARLLEEFVSVEGTKQPSTYAEVLGRIPSAEPWLQSALDLMQNSRLLRRVDDHYELAHDALAARIAERRSGESKQLLMVKKLVQNRLAEFAQTKTLLNPEELALVASTSKLVDPLDGSLRLKLDPAESDFIKHSRSTNRRRRFGRIGLVLAAVLVPLLAYSILAQAQKAKEITANMNNVADVLAFGNFQSQMHSSDPYAVSLAQWTHEVVRNDNIKRDQGDKMNERDYTLEDANNSFWGRLYDTDEIAIKEPTAGSAKYRELEDEMAEFYAADPNDIRIIGKYKAAMWHHIFMQTRPDRKLAEHLFDFMAKNAAIDDDPLDFAGDLVDLCYQPTIRKLIQQRCTPYPNQALESDSAAPPASDEPPLLKY